MDKFVYFPIWDFFKWICPIQTIKYNKFDNINYFIRVLFSGVEIGVLFSGVEMKIIKGGITFPKGFYAIGEKAGIKLRKKDLCVIYSKQEAIAAGCFTSNQVKAAPVIVSKEKLENGIAQAIVVNSGCANACTGKKGLKDSKKTVEIAAKELNLNEKNVLVASTGLIGSFLPMDKIKKALFGIKQKLGKGHFYSHSAAEAIMTTDAMEKEIAVKVNGISFGAMAKGAGMINPNMATMLCFISTDAIVSKKTCKKVLKEVVEKSFNMISVDGDMSTNDSVFLLANGASGKKISEKKLKQALELICLDMAKKIVSDGEGATKVIEAKVVNASSDKSAKVLALAIVNSPLVKTAVFGEDVNWGRVMATIGSTGNKFNSEKVDVFFGNIKVVGKGIEVKFDNEKLKKILTGNNVPITVKINNGKKQATAWGCDLTYKYVGINSAYHT